MKKNRLFTWIIPVLLAVNLCATGGIMAYLLGTREAADISSAFSGSQQAVRYTLYIGTNDKDTYTQLISLDEAKETVNRICAEHVGGYTVMEAAGGWTDETGTLTQEETLVYSFTDVQEEALLRVMDEVLEELNQSSILVEVSGVRSLYYYGE